MKGKLKCVAVCLVLMGGVFNAFGQAIYICPVASRLSNSWLGAISSPSNSPIYQLSPTQSVYGRPQSFAGATVSGGVISCIYVSSQTKKPAATSTGAQSSLNNCTLPGGSSCTSTDPRACTITCK